MGLTRKDYLLLFLGEQCAKSAMQVAESTGLSELATVRGICTSSASFRVLVDLLKKEGLVKITGSESRTQRYSLTDKGRQMIGILKQEMEDQRHVDNETEERNMPSQSIGEQLQAKGVKGGTYAPPSGLSLPKEGTYSQDVKGLVELFKDRIDPNPTENDQQRLHEEFTKLTAEGRPAFHWIQEAICRTSVKVRAEQRNMAYMLGILKSWRNYGYGTDYSAESKKMFDIFERHFDCAMTDASRQALLKIVDDYGVIDAMDALFHTKDEETDPALRYVHLIEQTLNKGE